MYFRTCFFCVVFNEEYLSSEKKGSNDKVRPRVVTFGLYLYLK